LLPRRPAPLRQQVAAFREGLKESAYVEGQNVAIEYRYAEGQPDRFPAFAADLVRRQVAVFAVGSTGAALIARTCFSPPNICCLQPFLRRPP
jgi:putative ABC transport system substrate-binding protein